MEISGERHIEMTWRCSTCQHQNLGRHKACQACANPKDGSEAYEMPAYPELAASVTDADLLRMATAGPDWRCAYCGSDQRRADASCATCGASIEAAEPPDDVPTPAAAVRGPRARPTAMRHLAIGAIVTAAVTGGLVWNARRTHDYDATVSWVAWEHVIEIDRYALRTTEGFADARPAEPVSTRRLGQRVHHYDAVVDHYEPERYSVEVADGYRTEHYTARESCGQDCTTRSPTCRQSCTSRRNGFASCRQSCSGGGRSCTTRYCSVARTRQVAKTRTEWRTRKVPKYRQVPRYAEAFRWTAWAWAPERTAREAGTDPANVRWPDGARTTGLPQGEQERERRRATYTVTLRFDGDSTVRFEVASPEALRRFAMGTRHALHWETDAVRVDGTAIRPLP